MNYCSNCGHPVILTEVGNDPIWRFYCEACETVHYRNPRMVAGCLATWENRVLLCRRSIEPETGMWNIPAGYLENGETVEEGAIRETREEANAEVDILNVHCIYSLPHINQIYVHFLAELKNPDVSAGEESLEAELFSEAGIPWDELAFSSRRFALEKFFQDRKCNKRNVHLGALKK